MRLLQAICQERTSACSIKGPSVPCGRRRYGQFLHSIRARDGPLFIDTDVLAASDTGLAAHSRVNSLIWFGARGFARACAEGGAGETRLRARCRRDGAGSSFRQSCSASAAERDSRRARRAMHACAASARRRAIAIDMAPTRLRKCRSITRIATAPSTPEQVNPP
jgi:hypothetical protein